MRDDGAVLSVPLRSCEINMKNVQYMILRGGSVRVGQNSIRFLTDNFELAGIIHLKDVVRLFLSYREIIEKGVSLRTTDIGILVRSPERLYKLSLEDFESRSNLVETIGTIKPDVGVMHLNSSSLDEIFGTGEHDQDSDAETIFSDDDDEEQVQKTESVVVGEHPDDGDAI